MPASDLNTDSNQSLDSLPGFYKHETIGVLLKKKNNTHTQNMNVLVISLKK